MGPLRDEALNSDVARRPKRFLTVIVSYLSSICLHIRICHKTSLHLTAGIQIYWLCCIGTICIRVKPMCFILFGWDPGVCSVEIVLYVIPNKN